MERKEAEAVVEKACEDEQRRLQTEAKAWLERKRHDAEERRVEQERREQEEEEEAMEERESEGWRSPMDLELEWPGGGWSQRQKRR